MMRLWPRRKTGPFIREGDAAARAGDWTRAASNYEQVLARDPGNQPIWVQLGHALRQLKQPERARLAYERAIALSPDDADALVQLARTLEATGDLEGACRNHVAALERDPVNWDALRGLILAGRRDLIPEHILMDLKSGLASRRDEATTELAAACERLEELSVAPLTAYQRYREGGIEPPPAQIAARSVTITVLIDARESSPAFLQATLFSLLDQSHEAWTAIVIAQPTLSDHPVASIASSDGRVRFRDEGEAAIRPDGDWVVHISAGTRLDANALAWLAFTADLTGCAAIFSDHDHGADHWREGMRFEGPRLYGVFDRDWMAATRFVPALVATKALVPERLVSEFSHDEGRRTLLLCAGGNVAHLPLILATILRLPDRALAVPQQADATPTWSRPPIGSLIRGDIPHSDGRIALLHREKRPSLTVSPVVRKGERIDLIVQTRDGGAMLAKAIDSLRAHASDPDRIAITVVNNRSQDIATLDILCRLAEDGVSVVQLDAPFNWSHANNIVAEGSRAEQLLFVNDDIEMLTGGWDELLLGYLQREDIGIVGVRLLYPDGSIQHAGVLPGMGMGADRGTFIHDGLRSTPQDAGPLDRFDVTRSAAAVTGAFMAIRRDRFAALGGFDAPRMPVGYSDIDLCFKARAAGWRVLYAPAIEAVHLESKTRGINDSRARVAWDLGELGALYRRWGMQMMVDPSLNPQWGRSRAFEGLKRPTHEQMIDHIRRSALTHPWSMRASETGVEGEKAVLDP